MDESWILEQAKLIICNFEKNGKTSKKELSKTFWKRFGTPRRTKKLISQVIKIFESYNITITSDDGVFGEESENSWIILSVEESKLYEKSTQDERPETELYVREPQTDSIPMGETSFSFQPLVVNIDNKPQILTERKLKKTAFIKSNTPNKSCIILSLIIGIPILFCYLLSFKDNGSGNSTSNYYRQLSIDPVGTKISSTLTYIILIKEVEKTQTQRAKPTSTYTPTPKPTIPFGLDLNAPYIANKKWKIIRSTSPFAIGSETTFYQFIDGHCSVYTRSEYISDTDGEVSMIDDDFIGKCIITDTTLSTIDTGRVDSKWWIEDSYLYLEDSFFHDITILEEVK